MPKLAVFTYHYLVDRDSPQQRSILGPGREDFARQVAFWADRYPLLRPQDLGSFFKGEVADEDTHVLFTFDDGLREHAEFAADVLERHGTRGMFFVPTCLLRREPVPAVALHYSLAVLRYAPTVGLLNAALERHGEQQRFHPQAGEGVAEGIARLKRFVRCEVPESLIMTVMGEVFRVGLEARAPGAFDRVFLGSEDIRILAAHGHWIGGHTDSHVWMAGGLAPQAGAGEITQSLACLGEELGQPVRSFAYPFGSEGDPVCRVLLQSAGIQFAFTTERRLNEPGTDPFRIARYSVYGSDTMQTLGDFIAAGGAGGA